MLVLIVIVPLVLGTKLTVNVPSSYQFSNWLVLPAAPVLAVHGAPKEPATRVTLSAATLSQADELWILATGAAKSAAVRLAFDSAAGPFQMPVRGVRGRLRTVWYVDDDAADRLPAGFGRRD